jgi:hypothetical protein
VGTCDVSLFAEVPGDGVLLLVHDVFDGFRLLVHMLVHGILLTTDVVLLIAKSSRDGVLLEMIVSLVGGYRRGVMTRGLCSKESVGRKAK